MRVIRCGAALPGAVSGYKFLALLVRLGSTLFVTTTVVMAILYEFLIFLSLASLSSAQYPYYYGNNGLAGSVIAGIVIGKSTQCTILWHQ